MDIIGIFVLLVITLIFFLLTQPSQSGSQSVSQIDTQQNITHPTIMTESFNNSSSVARHKSKYNSKYNSEYIRRHNKMNDKIIHDVISWDGDIKNNTVLIKEHVNPNFINNQFHNDYRDVITALNNIVPDKKQLFNLANQPVWYTEPETNEVQNLITDFIDILNSNILSEVPNKRNKNSGWDEAVVDPNMKSGWDTIQESLGLNPSLWNKPATKNKIRIIRINNVQKYETEDEIKYCSEIIIQKNNVDDQLVLKTSFVQDKRPIHNENNFFVSKNIEMKVTIEEIYILGYLSKEGNDSKLMFDRDEVKFYDYNAMEHNNMTDPKYIQHVLMDKYKTRTMEMEQRNATLDEEGQEFHKDLPHIYDFSNIKGTRTIIDDMNMTKTFV
jgi:hypothetical protein